MTYFALLLLDLSTTKYGECLALQVEERLRFLEVGGEVPTKNVDMMQRVLDSSIKFTCLID
jgi:hypothetical protein